MDDEEEVDVGDAKDLVGVGVNVTSPTCGYSRKYYADGGSYEGRLTPSCNLHPTKKQCCRLLRSPAGGKGEANVRGTGGTISGQHTDRTSGPDR